MCACHAPGEPGRSCRWRPRWSWSSASRWLSPSVSSACPTWPRRATSTPPREPSSSHPPSARASDSCRPRSGSKPCSARRARPGPSSSSSTREGDVKLDASLGMADRAALRRVVGEHAGEAITGLGRVRFASQPLDAPPSTLVSRGLRARAQRARRGAGAAARAHRAHDAARRRRRGGRLRRVARREQGRRLRRRARARHGARALRAHRGIGAGAHHGRGRRPHRRVQRPGRSLRRRADPATRATSNACAPPTAIARASSPP